MLSLDFLLVLDNETHIGNILITLMGYYEVFDEVYYNKKNTW